MFKQNCFVTKYSSIKNTIRRNDTKGDSCYMKKLNAREAANRLKFNAKKYQRKLQQK